MCDCGIRKINRSCHNSCSAVLICTAELGKENKLLNHRLLPFKRKKYTPQIYRVKVRDTTLSPNWQERLFRWSMMVKWSRLFIQEQTSVIKKVRTKSSRDYWPALAEVQAAE